jgi:hypothetical protein
MNQPGDVRFVINSMLQSDSESGPLNGLILTSEVGVAGHSDGAVTTLAFLNSCCKDPRVKAAEVLAGDPEMYPGGKYIFNGKLPTLIAHGTLDPLLPYNQMASFYNRMKGPKAFLSLTGANHTDWLSPTSKWFGSTVRATTDFFLRYLHSSATAAARLPRDGQSGVSWVRVVPGTGSGQEVALLPQPKTDRKAWLSSSKGLANGQVITVHWNGYLTNKVVNVVECSSSTEAGCDVGAGRVLIPDTKGDGSVTIRLVEGSVGNGECVPTSQHCQIVVNDAGLETPSASVRIPIAFAK